MHKVTQKHESEAQSIVMLVAVWSNLEPV